MLSNVKSNTYLSRQKKYQNSHLKFGLYFSDLESRLVNAEAANNSLQRKNVALAETKSALERDLDDKELQINAHKRDQQKSSRKLKTQLSQQEVIFQLVEL